MRRDTFLKTLAIGAATAGLPLSALAGSNIKMMIPANPGGGWDGTGRALGKALIDAKLVDTVQYENKGGAAGVIGRLLGLHQLGVRGAQLGAVGAAAEPLCLE